VVDDDPLARRMLRDVLQRAGITVIAEASSGREAVELARYYRPDIVVMDLIMPGVDGLAATREIVASVPQVRVVILTSGDDDDVGLMTLRAGAAGIISKDVGTDSLPHVLLRAHAGEAVISRRMTMRLIEDLRATRQDSVGLRPVRSPLTSREWEVLDLLCSGLTVDDIAEQLVLARDTVRTHVKRLLRKLGAHSQAEAIEIANGMRSTFTPTIPAVPDDPVSH
jgi:two-component system nitrate/nitrite response regulator NarL